VCISVPTRTGHAAGADTLAGLFDAVGVAGVEHAKRLEQARKKAARFMQIAQTAAPRPYRAPPEAQSKPIDEANPLTETEGRIAWSIWANAKF
jgi:hypothetical protein